MILVKRKMNQAGMMYGFTVKGHAGFADKGQDIVCAAVSMLSINTVNSIEQFTEDDFVLDTKEDGYLDCTVRGLVSAESELLLKSLWLGLTQVASQYGEEYIKIVS